MPAWISISTAICCLSGLCQCSLPRQDIQWRPRGSDGSFEWDGESSLSPGTLLSFSAGSVAVLESGWQRAERHAYLGDWVFCGREKFLGQLVRHMMGKHDKRPFNVTDPAVRPVNQMLVMGPSSAQTRGALLSTGASDPGPRPSSDCVVLSCSVWWLSAKNQPF